MGVPQEGDMSQYARKPKTPSNHARKPVIPPSEDLVQGVHVIIWEMEPGGPFSFVNDYAVELLGYPLERWLSDPEFWASMIHPEDRQWAMALCDSATRRGLDHDFAYRAITADGRTVWLRDKVHVVTDESGRVVRLHGAMFDITEQKAIEAALRESEEQFRQLADNINEIFWIMTVSDRRVIYVSPAFKRVWGRHFDSLSDVRSVFRDLHPDDRARVAAAIDAAASGDETTIEYQVIAADGRVRWFRSRIVPVRNDAREIFRIVGISEDITEKKAALHALSASEARFRALTENAPDVISIMDEQGKILYESPAIERVLGFKPTERVGHSGFDFVHPDDQAIAGQRLQEMLANPGRPIAVNLRVIDKQGSWRNAQVTATNLLQDESVQGIVLNWRDLTDRMILEEQFRQSQKMDAIGRLAGGVAHDFNNLLTAIQGHAELLLEEVGDNVSVREDAEQIAHAAQRAASLTRQLLAFSRRQVLQPKTVDLNAIVENMERLLRRLIGEHINLVTLLDDEAGFVNVDTGQLEQVLMNLVVNARDAMARGGQITIATHKPAFIHRPAPGMYTVISVNDNGIGMDEQTLANVFEPFFTTKEAGKGTGLGLSTVYGIVEQSGGHVWAESQVGKGSTFFVALPPAPAPETTNGTPAPAPTSSRGGTILVVEDEDSLRSLIRRSLARKGYTVFEASNGEEALAIAREQGSKIDLVLTDVVMPGMRGRELAEHLKAFCPKLRVIFMSGYDEAEVLNQETPPSQRRQTEFIEKPFTPESLVRRLNEILQRPPTF
jgi:two-component system, cell cycle sensor histidine kinase and response regulator CckA